MSRAGTSPSNCALRENRIERLNGLPNELVRLNVDVIVALATPASRAAQQATKTVPIVASAMGDPVQDGLVKSLAHPGGNITGTGFLGPELVPKRLALLRELLPNISRVAVLWHPGAFSDHTTNAMMSDVTQAAGTLGMQLQFVEARQSDEIEPGFTKMASNRAEALFVFPSPMLFSERQRIVSLAATHRLPAAYNARQYVQDGGLFSYGSSSSAVTRDAPRSM